LSRLLFAAPHTIAPKLALYYYSQGCRPWL